jgi:hypothetical protein
VPQPPPGSLGSGACGDTSEFTVDAVMARVRSTEDAVTVDRRPAAAAGEKDPGRAGPPAGVLVTVAGRAGRPPLPVAGGRREGHLES